MAFMIQRLAEFCTENSEVIAFLRVINNKRARTRSPHCYTSSLPTNGTPQFIRMRGLSPPWKLAIKARELSGLKQS